MLYLNSLNDKQKEAVLYTEGPLLIVAGAGAGKTKTITHRIIHLIHQGVSPDQILALTFTNKAAKEMRDRVISMLDTNEKEIPFVSTFHSLGVNIIKENAKLIGLTKYFTILDESDSITIIKNIMKDFDIDLKQHEPRKIKSIIGRAKGDFLNIDKYNIEAKSHLQNLITKIWREYELRLKKEKSLDFDDLLIETVMILKKYPDIKKYYQNKWHYIHIDEYQDTNEVQYELTKLLVGEKQNICVVGDTDQNIYSWRGANIKNILHFEKDFPNAKIITLEQNYRSTKNIIEAANNVIEKNKYRIPKNLFTEKSKGETISVYEAYDEISEANFIAKTINDLLKKVIKPEEIAILYRANFQSRVLEEALLARQIPYQVLGIKFFERKEIKDLISYIKAAYNKESLSDVKRIINVPTRGIGKLTLLKILSGQFDSLPIKMQMKINNFYSLLDDIKKYGEENKPSETIKYIIKKSGLENELMQGSADEQERLENMKELVTLATKYDKLPKEIGLEKLLEDAALSSDQDTLIYSKDIKNKEGIKLMTVHASKGLEFKYVFISGLEQDLFPHVEIEKRTGEDKEEERRLFYVAITRAQHKLYLTYSLIRTIFGMKQVNTPSEFIYDIPPHLINFEQGRIENREKIIYL